MKIKDILSQWNDFSPLVRLYAVGLAVFVLGVPVGLFSIGLYINLIFFSLFCFGLGFTIEIIQTIRVIWDTAFAKGITALLSLLSVLCWLTATTLSHQAINLYVSVDPSKFPLAIQAFTIIFFIVIWLVLIGIFLLILPLLLMFTPHKPTIASIFESRSVNKNSQSRAKYPALFGRTAGSFAIVLLLNFEKLISAKVA